MKKELLTDPFSQAVPDRQWRPPYIIEGLVIHGDRHGQKVGFPTINIQLERGKLPPEGIYGGVVRVNQRKYAAAAYVGFRPTMNEHSLRIEAHLLKFKGDLYGKSVKLTFIRFIRSDIKFDTFEALSARIKLDCQQAEQIYQEYQQQDK